MFSSPALAATSVGDADEKDTPTSPGSGHSFLLPPPASVSAPSLLALPTSPFLPVTSPPLVSGAPGSSRPQPAYFPLPSSTSLAVTGSSARGSGSGSGSGSSSSGSGSVDVSQRLNRRLMLRRVFMQLQSAPGDKGERVGRAQFRDALAANGPVMAFLGGSALLDRVAVRGTHQRCDKLSSTAANSSVVVVVVVVVCVWVEHTGIAL